MPERRDGEPLACRQIEPTVVDRLQHVGVEPRVHHHGDGTVILGARPDHGRTTDVDLFDDLHGRGTRPDRLDERVQVRYQQLKWGDTEPFDGRHVLRIVLISK